MIKVEATQMLILFKWKMVIVLIKLILNSIHILMMEQMKYSKYKIKRKYKRKRKAKRQVK